jgi:hypothetical protein
MPDDQQAHGFLGRPVLLRDRHDKNLTRHPVDAGVCSSGPIGSRDRPGLPKRTCRRVGAFHRVPSRPLASRSPSSHDAGIQNDIGEFPIGFQTHRRANLNPEPRNFPSVSESDAIKQRLELRFTLN